MKNEKIVWWPLDRIKPYENNPRKISDKAVGVVAESIREFGFKNPILVDATGVIIAGHTRRQAAIKLGLQQVPVIVCDDLTEQQVKAFRLADNKTGEFTEWDIDMLEAELLDVSDLDMSAFGFIDDEQVFFNSDRSGQNKQEGNDEYNEFVEKFEAKRTTDDCFTPDHVYEAVGTWVAERYSLDKASFVRPFYPGGDYKNYKYNPESVVVDNPPFSILSEIKRFYCEHGIRFFLFAPSLTIFGSAPDLPVTYVVADADIVYENGANVLTGFVTNLESPEILAFTSWDLKHEIEKSYPKKESLPNYKYPSELVTAARMQAWADKGLDFVIRRAEAFFVRGLDAAPEKGIYGGGYLVSADIAAKAAKADKADKAARRHPIVFELSEREKEIVQNLG